jgi:hypothetical protein
MSGLPLVTLQNSVQDAIASLRFTNGDSELRHLNLIALTPGVPDHNGQTNREVLVAWITLSPATVPIVDISSLSAEHLQWIEERSGFISAVDDARKQDDWQSTIARVLRPACAAFDAIKEDGLTDPSADSAVAHTGEAPEHTAVYSPWTIKDAGEAGRAEPTLEVKLRLEMGDMRKED